MEILRYIDYVLPYTLTKILTTICIWNISLLDNSEIINNKISIYGRTLYIIILYTTTTGCIKKWRYQEQEENCHDTPVNMASWKGLNLQFSTVQFSLVLFGSSRASCYLLCPVCHFGNCAGHAASVCFNFSYRQSAAQYALPFQGSWLAIYFPLELLLLWLPRAIQF